MNCWGIRIYFTKSRFSLNGGYIVYMEPLSGHEKIITKSGFSLNAGTLNRGFTVMAYLIELQRRLYECLIYAFCENILYQPFYSITPCRKCEVLIAVSIKLQSSRMQCCVVRRWYGSWHKSASLTYTAWCFRNSKYHHIRKHMARHTIFYFHDLSQASGLYLKVWLEPPSSPLQSSAYLHLLNRQHVYWFALATIPMFQRNPLPPFSWYKSQEVQFWGQCTNLLPPTGTSYKT
jgi:hypothetical protein